MKEGVQPGRPPPFESIILYSFENNTLLRIMY